ncbi:MAG TPA: hypothetical protein VMH27_09090 [Puia sp.]|nr:hypothetical protein [Puia sp.]
MVLDDILSLIIQGSTKANKEGKTGRFGTGFMTTYLLSKRVRISGTLINNQGCFEFILNRDAENNDQFYHLQQLSNTDFETSIRETSYLGDSEFQTKFTYYLDSKGKKTAEIGLQNLDELIPVTQLFNEQIESVIIIDTEKSKTFSTSLARQHDSELPAHNLKEWKLETLINDKVEKEYRAYVIQHLTYDSCVITHIQNESQQILPLTDNYPRLYFTFPLIGTEEIGIPIIINSNKFDPKKERDGIYLNESENSTYETNRKIIEEALKHSSKAFTILFSQLNISGIVELFNYRNSKDLKWVDAKWLNKIKKLIFEEMSNLQVLKFNNNADDLSTLKSLTIPNANTDVYLDKLWFLLSRITEIKIPIKIEAKRWIEVIANAAKLSDPEIDVSSIEYVFNINKLIGFIEKKESCGELNKVLSGALKEWLNDFYSIIRDTIGAIPLDRNILLNQDDRFRKGEGMLWDNSKEEELVSISKLLKINFSNKLISTVVEPISIVGIETFHKQDAIRELISYFNSISESNFPNADLLDANARFLKWLINSKNKDGIRDLRVLTGESKKIDEGFVFDLFPKIEHLLLLPKKVFEGNFPLYANLIRDKDCLNEGYSPTLSDDDFRYLESNGFINFSPLLKRKDTVSSKILELLVCDDNDLNLLRDKEGQISKKVLLEYSDFGYLTTNPGHIYDRNSTQRSSLERFKFLLLEAVEKDPNFDNDIQEINVDGVDKPILFKKCLWVYRARKLSWVNIKSDDGSPKGETPSSSNLSELIKKEDSLIKAIKGAKQQLLLHKMGVGVSDLIRNTLASDELRFSWDKAITNMITSEADPELAQEIFGDPGIKSEYEKRLRNKKIISRNQKIGQLVEELLKKTILAFKQKGYLINIERRPFGSDYVVTDESSDLVNDANKREGFVINDWLIELKATGKEYASMTPLQAKTAVNEKNNYALIVVPLDGSDPDLDYVQSNARVIKSIGKRIEAVIPDYDDVENKKSELSMGRDGVSIKIDDQEIRFRISSQIWQSEEAENIESFVDLTFKVGAN